MPTYGIGPAAADADVVLDLSPLHPSTHGGLRLALTLDGDRVGTAEPLVGYLHRGAEKLFEVRDYRQVLVLANRHDWLSAFSNELGIVLAVERMLGMEVPPRAVWLRTLLAELNRVLASLMFLGTFPLEIGTDRPAFSALHQREAVQGLMEEATGGRVHFMFNRVGGLLVDVPAGWSDRARAVLAQVRTAVLDDLDPVVRTDELFRARTAGIGVLPAEVALAYGVSGPMARASGVDLDLRRDDPYLAYGDLDVPVVLGTGGDAWERFRVLLDQVYGSLDLAEQCLDRLPAGEVNVRLPKTVRAPEGATYVWTENPLGAMGYYLVSRGERTPYRLAMRTASFNNVSALPAVLPGTRVADLVPVLASLFFVVGDIDK
ncbi:MAG: NADH-quinone oxidoreductase subunit NuoD [Frankiales bacterium]|jgi:NADH-quinone oxidoreductase subunit D|nr:NADH-quinone oxidoreductase subunit NuoD [Frankiales bacterium]